ncbi:vacuolar protein sorting-associated protein 8-like [Tropilaelaps mercedesae]|uniref:Vacuolar protein sorting-associated protein 8-like n=1 Tax=Tropilaelaps mercedesae TaxID=418985 RepID=A0A1V9Y155_9ACAR|nr:vacuolar protein sorting-associated protein 8-like [Tropilaelaps mercedesae]
MASPEPKPSGSGLNEEAHFSGDFDAASGSIPFFCSEINFNEISDTLSIASGISSLSSASRLRRSPKPAVKGSVVRHVQLRQIGAQLQRAFESGEVGSPSAMAVSTLIAIGTSNGVTLVFDSEQTLTCKLGASELAHGLVSAVSFNGDATRIIVGHSKGHMTMWDTSNGKLLRNLADVHTPNHGVLLLAFTDDPATAVVTDTGGSVFEVNFKKILTSRSYESSCIFSGSRGEVCAMEPLRVSRKFRGYLVEGLSLVALGTVTRCIVVLLRPVVTVVFTHQLRAETDTIPVLSWQFSFFQEGSRKICSPVLAFGRKSTIYLFRVHTQSSHKVTFEPLQQLEVSYTMRQICFVNYKTLAILDHRESLRFLDVRVDEEVESMDCSDLEIIYEGRRYRAEDTGGNVSKAMTVIGETACTNTMVPFGSQCVILGGRGIHIYSIRSWTERVNFFSKQKLYSEALKFAISYYNDEGDAASSNRVIEIVSPKTEKSQALVAEKIALLIEEFGLFLVDREGQKIDNLLTHYAANVPLCIHYAVILSMKYQILDTLYELFAQDPMALTVFLSCLQPYISGGDLPELNPVIVKDFVNLLSCENKFGELERSLVQLSVTSIDIHQVMTICKENRLYDAIIHIHNAAMLDYTGPIEEMVDIIAAPLATNREPSYAEVEVGNKLIVYISCCLAGAAYPCGVLSKTEARRAHQCIVQYLTTPVPSGSVRSPFYCLRTLLHFNAREFLNVLSLAFQDEQFNAVEESVENTEAPDSLEATSLATPAQDKQQIVDILLQLMVREEGFETHEMGALFTFLARQMAMQDTDMVIRVDKQLFEQVVEYLTNVNDESRMEERQQAMMELLTSGGLKDIAIERLLELAEPARFYRVCEVLYERQRRFDKVLLCYLNDQARRIKSFTYVTQIFNGDEYNQAEKTQLENQVVAVIDELIQVDALSTAALIIDLLPTRIKQVLDRLEGLPETQYHLLEGAYRVAAGECQDTVIAVKDAEAVTLSPDVQEKYVELKCIFDPDGVLTFLKSAEYFRELEANERESMWFRLLDVVMQSQKNSLDRPDLKELISSLLNAMMGYVSPHSILSKVMSDPAYNLSEFKEVRRFIGAMIDTYNFEQTMLSTTSNLINGDLSSKLADLKRLANRAVVASVVTCTYCGRPFAAADTREVVVFRCGHGYHRECVDQKLEARTTEDLKCLRCGRMTCASFESRFEVLVNTPSAAHTGRMEDVTDRDQQVRKRRIKIIVPRLLPKEAYKEGNDTRSATVYSTLSPAQMEALEHFKMSQKMPSTSTSNEEVRLRAGTLLSRDDFKLFLSPPPDNPVARELFS